MSRCNTRLYQAVLSGNEELKMDIWNNGMPFNISRVANFGTEHDFYEKKRYMLYNEAIIRHPI